MVTKKHLTFETTFQLPNCQSLFLVSFANENMYNIHCIRSETLVVNGRAAVKCLWERQEENCNCIKYNTWYLYNNSLLGGKSYDLGDEIDLLNIRIGHAW